MQLTFLVGISRNTKQNKTKNKKINFDDKMLEEKKILTQLLLLLPRLFHNFGLTFQLTFLQST